MILLLETGAFRLMCSHIQLKNNLWYYRRRIPADVRHVHRDERTGKAPSQLFFSLKTSDKFQACKLADIETRRLDSLWSAARERGGEQVNVELALQKLKAADLVPGDGANIVDGGRGMEHPAIEDFLEQFIGHYGPERERPALTAQQQLTVDLLAGDVKPHTLLAARDLYISLGKGPRNSIAQGQFDRAWNLLLGITGDKLLTTLRRSDGNAFVAKLVEKSVSTATISKYIAQIAPVVALGIREFELDIVNPFEGLHIPQTGKVHERLPYSEIELRSLQEACRKRDDPAAWLLLAISDTGARLAEFLGMEQDEVYLDAPIPYVKIRPNSTRGLKTSNSMRDVPLVGCSLWAVRRAMEASGKHLFPSLLPKVHGVDFSANARLRTH